MKWTQQTSQQFLRKDLSSILFLNLKNTIFIIFVQDFFGLNSINNFKSNFDFVFNFILKESYNHQRINSVQNVN